jgi:hypothetical protein
MKHRQAGIRMIADHFPAKRRPVRDDRAADRHCAGLPAAPFDPT